MKIPKRYHKNGQNLLTEKERIAQKHQNINYEIIMHKSKISVGTIFKKRLNMGK